MFFFLLIVTKTQGKKKTGTEEQYVLKGRLEFDTKVYSDHSKFVHAKCTLLI